MHIHVGNHLKALDSKFCLWTQLQFRMLHCLSFHGAALPRQICTFNQRERVVPFILNVRS